MSLARSGTAILSVYLGRLFGGGSRTNQTQTQQPPEMFVKGARFLLGTHAQWGPGVTPTRIGYKDLAKDIISVIIICRLLEILYF